jgi:hypothetical protein
MSRPLPPAPPAVMISRRWTLHLCAGPQVVHLPPPPGRRPGLWCHCLALWDRAPAPLQSARSRIGPPRPRAPLQCIGPVIGNWTGEIWGRRCSRCEARQRAASSMGGRGGELGGWRQCSRCEAEGGAMGTSQGRRAWLGPGPASSVGGRQRAIWEAGGTGESWFVVGGR